MDKNQFRPGITPSEYPPITQLLLRKSPKPFNFLIGTDPFQTRFAEQVLGIKCRMADKVTDEDLLTGEPCLLSITTDRVVDISTGVRDKSSFWSIGPMKRGSAGAMAIVKHAASALGTPAPDKDALQRVADKLATDGIEDIRVAIWRALWLLLGPPVEEHRRWLEPWENYLGWLRPDVEPSYRLNTLFKDLGAYAFIMSGEEESLRKAGLGISPSKIKYLAGLKLNPGKVYDSLREISAWRLEHGDPYPCVMKVAAIWGSN